MLSTLVVLGGKLIGLFVVSTAAVVLGAALTWLAARLLASGAGVDPAAWTTADGLAAAAEAVGRALVGVAITIVLGTAIGLAAYAAIALVVTVVVVRRRDVTS